MCASTQQKTQDGFTLLELLVAMALLAIIATMSFSIMNTTASAWTAHKAQMSAFGDSRVIFETRFNNNDIFRSAVEIYTLWLVPAGRTLSNIATWWTTHRATGDHLRERPDAALYPLLTTKSNTYTVHVWTQSLTPNSDKATGEYRGSSTIERYIDPADDRLLESEFNPDGKSIEPLYRFRIVETKRFAP